MDSLVGYGSDDDVESERYGGHQPTVAAGSRRRDDDTNYDDVNMDMSEDSQEAESEPELPPAEPAPSKQSSRDEQRSSNESRGRGSDRSRDERRDRRRDSPARPRSDRDRRDDRQRSDRGDRKSGGHEGSSRRGLLGDRPDDRTNDSKQVPPALMELKPFGGDPPPGFDQKRSQDARDAVSPRFVERDRRDRDRERERDKDGRHSRRSEEKRSSHRHSEHRSRSRSRSRGAAFPPPSQHIASKNDRRNSPPSGDYRPSYKVNKKLEVMEKMGLQIKTPDGSMATAQQLRAAANDAPHPAAAASGSSAGSGLPTFFNSSAVQKRKLLWSNKNKTEAEEAAKWSGTRFAQDSDGKQVSKFMRLMGIKEPAAIKPEPDKDVDPIKKQEELFQAMQAQYEVARATTHTMRGVGLGFQRGQF